MLPTGEENQIIKCLWNGMEFKKELDDHLHNKRIKCSKRDHILKKELDDLHIKEEASKKS